MWKVDSADADQSVEVADGSKCFDGQKTIGDRDDGVNSAASAHAGNQLGHKIRLHYLHAAHAISAAQ